MKICKACKKSKPRCEYYPHPQTRDGCQPSCKDCVKARATDRRNRNLEAVRAYDRERSKLPHRRKSHSKATKKHREKNPIRYHAHMLLNSAVRSGRIKRPTVCCYCEKEGQIEGHHDDYFKPLEVEWYCSACHKEKHKREDAYERGE